MKMLLHEVLWGTRINMPLLRQVALTIWTQTMSTYLEDCD